MPESPSRTSAIPISEASWNRLFSHLFPRARNTARRRLAAHPLPNADEDDVAQSALKKLCLRLMNDELDRPASPDQLENLVKTMVGQKVIDYRRRERSKKRGGGHARAGAESLGVDGAGRTDIEQVCDRAPSAADLAIVNEQKERFLRDLGDPVLRQITLWKLEDRSNVEIAGLLGTCVRTVERKLHIIRRMWWNEILQ